MVDFLQTACWLELFVEKKGNFQVDLPEVFFYHYNLQIEMLVSVPVEYNCVLVTDSLLYRVLLLLDH